MTATKQQQAQKYLAARAWYTSGRLVEWTCPRCGSAGSDIADKCAAPLDDPCHGFLRIEELHKEFAENYDKLRALDH